MSKGKKPLRVTDHAIVRYLERHQNLNIDHVKALIATDEVKAIHKSIGNCKYTSKNGHTVVIDNNAIVTVY